MVLTVEGLFMGILAVVLSIIICIVTFFKWSYTYWKRRTVPFLEPHMPWGTLDNILSDPKSFAESISRQYNEAKKQCHTFVGLYAFFSPILMIMDPHLIKNVMSTDFTHFVDRGIYFNETDDPLSAHLFSIEGVKWRNLRIKLTPTFTSGKMKMMFNILSECGHQLKNVLDEKSAKHEPVDIKDILARFTTNIIGSAAFGIECNAFANVDSEFRKYGKKIFQATKFQLLKNTMAFINPKMARRLQISLNHSDVKEFFMQVVKDTVEYRETHNMQRNDFMQLLINLKNGIHVQGHEDEVPEYKHDGKSLTLEELAAQAFVFFIAGFETSSTTMAFSLFELAVNPDIQDKVREEIQEVLLQHHGEITYEAIHDMKYMEQVVAESLRKYPPLPVLNRKCTMDYKIPGTEIVVEKDTPVFIPIVGLHNDPEYFPNPEKFDPARFSEENKHNILPYTYLPFGEGPRICIGIRFGLMQTKVGLTVLLQNFRFSLDAKTKIPLRMDPYSFIQATVGDIWLNVEMISEKDQNTPK